MQINKPINKTQNRVSGIDRQPAREDSANGNRQTWQKPGIQVLSAAETRQLGPPEDPMQS